jgi:hypothetical protein
MKGHKITSEKNKQESAPPGKDSRKITFTVGVRLTFSETKCTTAFDSVLRDNSLWFQFLVI